MRSTLTAKQLARQRNPVIGRNGKLTPAFPLTDGQIAYRQRLEEEEESHRHAMRVLDKVMRFQPTSVPKEKSSPKPKMMEAELIQEEDSASDTEDYFSATEKRELFVRANRERKLQKID